MNWIKNKKITEEEIDKFYPMGEWIYDEYDDLKDKNAYKKMFLDSFRKPNDMKMLNAYFKAFDEHDKNKDEKLGYHEWMQFNNDL